MSRCSDYLGLSFLKYLAVTGAREWTRTKAETKTRLKLFLTLVGNSQDHDGG